MSLIDNFLSELTNNDKDAIAQIESFMAATLRKMGNCQKFLHLLGSGYGKSTLLRLMSDLVGKENAWSSSIKILESNNFETGNLIDKALTIFPNEHRCKGNFSRFLSLISGDDVRCKEKYKPWFTAPYRGMVAIASNNEVFDSKIDAIHNRRILIRCDFKPAIPDIYLDSKLASELPELTRRLLEIPSDEIFNRLNQEVKL